MGSAMSVQGNPTADRSEWARNGDIPLGGLCGLWKPSPADSILLLIIVTQIIMAQCPMPVAPAGYQPACIICGPDLSGRPEGAGLLGLRGAPRAVPVGLCSANKAMRALASDSPLQVSIY
jgi:hypothetical protein